MNDDKIIPNIWFAADDGSISNVVAYYKDIFTGNFSFGRIVPLGNTPSGKSELCEVTIFGRKYMFLNTANEHHPLNDAVSLVIYCEDQIEIDKYWDYLTREGKESQCGWCIDKYGLRWQVLPRNLGALMSRPNAHRVMMGQRKIVIEDYLK